MLTNPKKRKNYITKIPPPPKKLEDYINCQAFPKSFWSIKQS